MNRALLLGLALIAGPGFAKGFTADQKAALIALAAASDCDLTTAEVREHLSEVGVDAQVAEAIAVDLIDRGQAQVNDEATVLTLLPEICSS